MEETPRRAFWNGPPERLADAFRLTKRKGDRTFTAACEVWTHPRGWELRLVIEGHDWLTTSVARSADGMSRTVEHWRASLLTKGWSDPPGPGADDGADPPR